jgi:hypothetical protein
VSPQPRERELDLHAALGRQELVPFVDDDGAKRAEALAPVGARQEERQALGRRDEDRRQVAVLPGAIGARRVAGAHADRPMRLQRLCGMGERERGVLRERAQRRDPEDRERGRALGRAGGTERERADQRGERLPHAGRRMQQAGPALGVRAPHRFLEREGREALRSEPGARAGERVAFEHARRGRGVHREAAALVGTRAGPQNRRAPRPRHRPCNPVNRRVAASCSRRRPPSRSPHSARLPRGRGPRASRTSTTSSS